MITLNYTKEEVELILGALRKLPMELTEELVMKTRAQAVPQIQQPKQAEEQETPAV